MLRAESRGRGAENCRCRGPGLCLAWKKPQDGGAQGWEQREGGRDMVREGGRDRLCRVRGRLCRIGEQIV